MLHNPRDLGCNIDGFIAVAAHSFVIGASPVIKLVTLNIFRYSLF